jgi:hypothetical protein
VALALPEGFRGRIQPAEGAGPPSANAVASDGKRFVVLRATPALRALQGQSVSVARERLRPLRARDANLYLLAPEATRDGVRDNLLSPSAWGRWSPRRGCCRW